jgi:myo-inositol-1(or 4)-monophosphatase
MSLERLCADVQELAIKTAKFISEEQRKLSSMPIQSKGLHNYVTHVDTGAEERIVNGLQVLLPGSGFIAEEGTTSMRGKQYNWIIDPLDGTTNFIHGFPPYAISIALLDGDQTILGVIYELTAGECFYAWKDSQAYLNGKVIQVSKTKTVSQSLIATGFPYTNFSRIGPYMQTFKYFLKHSHGIRRLGSAATDIAYVACGRLEAFYEYGLHPWDVAAGAMILERAGGKTGDFSGGDNWMFGEEIITCNNTIYDEFLDLINRMMVQEQILIQ